MLEVFNGLFMHIAEQMGAVLEHTAHSVNIKERLDFSCALFDAAGDLIANAPHIPVHLGSMGDSVRAVLDAHAGAISPGDVFMLNAPYSGGTHLPDITVVTPVFDAHTTERAAAAAARLRFVVASRAHHADVGGLTPGSMPPFSRTIEEEGVMFAAVPIVRHGRFLEAELGRRFAAGPYPARNPEQNLADLKAQIAANARGVEELGKMVARFGLAVVHAYMAHVKQNAEECVRRAIDRLRDGSWTVELDGGEHISVRITIDRAAREAIIDFAGTSPASSGNFNAPASITRAAVLYVFRALVNENIPLNAGCLEPLRIRLPEGSLLKPRFPSAVVAGNVETSQCITDALLAALGACAAAQGTMNNFTFGDGRHQYYETICGGAGAGPDFDGASAVHTHMTNSRLTDAEIIEWRYPVRVRRFAVRQGSGGRGLRQGGDGVVREIEFLAPMHAAIVSNRRRVAPFGLHGGGPAAPGRNYVIRASGRIEELPAIAGVQVAAGDRFVIETPGGGGYG
jgi:5-oxoprolinase (ATP-hydrolysing)